MKTLLNRIFSKCCFNRFILYKLYHFQNKIFNSNMFKPAYAEINCVCQYDIGRHFPFTNPEISKTLWSQLNSIRTRNYQNLVSIELLKIMIFSPFFDLFDLRLVSNGHQSQQMIPNNCCVPLLMFLRKFKKIILKIFKNFEFFGSDSERQRAMFEGP